MSNTLRHTDYRLSCNIFSTVPLSRSSIMSSALTTQLPEHAAYSFASTTESFLTDELPLKPRERIVFARDNQSSMGRKLCDEDLKEGSQATLLSCEAGSFLELSEMADATFSGIGGVGASALLVHGVSKALGKDEETSSRVEGASNTLWGAQSLALTAANSGFAEATALKLSSQALGIVGAGIQFGLGLYKVATGDQEQRRIGVGEMVTGGFWAAATLTVTPQVTVPLLITATALTKGYEHREALARVFHRGVGAVKRLMTGSRGASDDCASLVLSNRDGIVHEPIQTNNSLESCSPSLTF